MKNLFVLAFVLLGATVELSAQQQGDVTIAVTSGLAGYSFNQMKEETLAIQQKISFKTSITDNYNSYYYYGISGSYRLTDKLNLGLNYQQISTGSRIGYSDYSGSFRLDQQVDGYQIGSNIGYIGWTNNGFSLEGNVLLSAIYTKHRIASFIAIGSQQEESSEKFSAVGLIAEPNLHFYYRYHMLQFGVKAGYCLNINDSLRWSEDNEAIYVDSKGNKMKPNWSGYRIGATLAIVLPQR